MLSAQLQHVGVRQRRKQNAIRRARAPTLVVAAQSNSGQAQLWCTTFPAASRPTRTRLCVLGEQQPAIRDSTAPISPRWLQLSSVLGLLSFRRSNAGTERS